jgi:catecholate siderophore receptor
MKRPCEATKKGNSNHKKQLKAIWPVTYRLAAMGTLVAYSALGATKVTLAAATFGAESGPKESDSQALVVRRFEIAPGGLDEVVSAFEHQTGVHVTLANPELGKLESPGVKGVYTTGQALVKILEGTGMTFQFTARDAVTLQLATVATSIEVSADVPEIASVPKYTQVLRDTPQTVNVIPQQVLQDQGTTTLRDALRNVAGISLAAGEGGAQGDNLTIRGFSARNDIFMDGMRDFGSYYRDPFDIEQVEVLQGPTSVTFGRGSTGGVVNQETKTAQVGKFVNGTMQFGSDLTRRITADVNEPIGQTAAFRLNLMGHDSQVSERDKAESRRFGVAPSLAFGLGTSTRLVLSYLHEQADDTPDYGIPWFFNAPADVDRNNYYGFEHGNFLKTNVDVGTIRAEHDFGSRWTLRNQARYGHFRRGAQITEARVPTTQAGIGTITPDTPLDQIHVLRNQIGVQSLETYLGDQLDATVRFRTGSLEHTVVMGMEGSRETSAPKRFTFLSAPDPTLPDVVPVPQASLTNPDEETLLNATRLKRTSVHDISIGFGAYAVDTVKVGRHLELVGGIRWDRFDTDFDQLTYSNSNQRTPAVSPHLSRMDEEPSYRAAVVYKPARAGSIYFDYGTSFNPSAESLALSPATVDAPPEKNRTYEIGTKWDLPSKRLSVSASVFRTNKLTAREPSMNDPLVNDVTGEQRVNGAQIAVTGRITDRWQLLSSYAYLDGKLVKSLAFPTAVGAQLANVPRNTFNAWTTYEMPWKFTVGGGTQFVDSRTASTTAPTDPTTGLTKQIPSYWVFNSMMSHPLTERITFQLNLYNLANRYYFDLPHPGHVIPGPGFTALAGLNFKF